MKNIYKLFSIILLIILLPIMFSVQSFSMKSGFTFESVPESYTRELIDYLDLEYLKSSPTIEKNFECFDINAIGDVALGFSDVRGHNYIIVYNSKCEFKYALSYNGVGSYGLEWDGCNIIIYSVRGEWAVLVDEFGTIMEVKEIQRNLKNDSYWRNNIFASKRIVEDTIYEADTLLGNYSRLVKLTPDGQEQVIFENTVGITFFYVVVIAVVCIVLAVFAAFWIVLIKMIIKEMRKNKQQN